ncbi:MAG: GntR family transcriptional regulator [Rhodobacteraceae bacterium]|nr:GntR family transcriptional regulator [Paracoccaceae bacterium]
MKNQTLWQGIASDLEKEIVAGSLARGSRLPTESMLSQRYGVNRHTIRKALSHLAEKSLIWSKRGSGVFVMQKPTIYSMGERVRFSQNLLDAGRTPSRQKLSLSQRLATHEEASSLQIKKNSKVHHYEGISFANDPLLCTTSLNTDQSGTPIEFGRTYFSGKHVTLSYEA